MNFQDILMFNMFINNIPKIETEYYYLNILYILIVLSFIITMFIPSVKYKTLSLIDVFLSKFNKTKNLLFSSLDKENSKRFRAIMYHISKSNDPSVNKLIEIMDTKYNRNNDRYEETNNTIYRVDQSSSFKINNNINGKVIVKERERSNFNGRTDFDIIITLHIYSTKLNLKELQDWVDEKLKAFETHLKKKSCNSQLLIDVSWDPKEKELVINDNVWSSNVTFANRFFTNKDNIVKKIHFFLESKKWYEDRGIPYTMGFLLWGDPGCGKTGFIKALMNLTGRHAISIKLNNKFDMNRLKEIIYNDEISNDLIITQDNRILIFEDIDCMDDIVKDRDLDKKEIIDSKNNNKNNKDNKDNKDDKDNNSINLKYELKSILENTIDISNNYNNNLSYFLNILDGLQECPGRIIVMTTNKPENLDKALIRPGRIDFNINFTKATVDDIKNIISHYWNYDIKNIKNLDANIDFKLSHADIVNICRTTENINDTIDTIHKKINLLL